MTTAEFLAGVRRVAASDPTYRTGGDGSDGTCDCVGLIMGALGGEYPMHSSNWFARYRTDDLVQLTSAAQPKPGMIVYKARNGNQAGYDLHERYMPGGRYDTGDLLDYYHVGVVESVEPLTITHCTKNDAVDGIACDDSITGWTHCGDVSGVEYADQEDDPMLEGYPYTAMVATADGNPLKLRKTPSTRLDYIGKIPNGDTLTVHEQAAGWATVTWQGQRGYVMSAYLKRVQDGDENAENAPGNGPDAGDEQVTITIDKNAARALYEALGSVL